MTYYDLAAVLSHYGIAYPNRTGWAKVKCPVHDDHTPSCSLNLSTNYMECHACDFRGHALDLIMRLEGCDIEAAKRVAATIPGAGDGAVSGGAGWRTGRSVSGREGHRPGGGRKPPSRGRWH